MDPLLFQVTSEERDSTVEERADPLENEVVIHSFLHIQFCIYRKISHSRTI